jgi:hypothetical protein
MYLDVINCALVGGISTYPGELWSKSLCELSQNFFKETLIYIYITHASQIAAIKCCGGAICCVIKQMWGVPSEQHICNSTNFIFLNKEVG